MSVENIVKGIHIFKIVENKEEFNEVHNDIRQYRLKSCFNFLLGVWFIKVSIFTPNKYPLETLISLMFS
ncbi:MAG TPA: hypothetical protein DIW31_12520 [Bacteroidales bacterium]|nr:hypothetical protein [Bacteroidales bacterium]